MKEQSLNNEIVIDKKDLEMEFDKLSKCIQKSHS